MKLILVLVVATCGQSHATDDNRAELGQAWPEFKTYQDLQASPWVNYYRSVYCVEVIDCESTWGQIPYDFPLKTEDLWILYDTTLAMFPYDVPVPASVGTCPTASPSLGQRYQVNNHYQPQKVSWIWHPYPYAALPANSWVEVLHQADPFGDEHYGAWLMYAPGTGIYFHLGTTISFHEHQDAYNHFSITSGSFNEELSKAAANQGYDSIQFLSHVDHVNYPCDTKNTGNAGLAYMGMEVVACKLVGTHACCGAAGAPAVIKKGWAASRPCACDNKKQFMNCNMPPTQASAMNSLNVSATLFA